MKKCLPKRVLELDFMEDHRAMLLMDLIHWIYQGLLLADMELVELLRMESSHTLTCIKIILVRKDSVSMDGSHISILSMVVISYTMKIRK